jgi:hypothetical protein
MNVIKRIAVRFSVFIFAMTLGIAVDNALHSLFLRAPADKYSCRRQDTDLVATTPVCEIHGEHMSRRYVSILAGVPGYSVNENSYLAAKASLFPNSNFFIIDRSRSVTQGHAEVNVCSKCRAAERVWIESRPNANGIFIGDEIFNLKLKTHQVEKSLSKQNFHRW